MLNHETIWAAIDALAERNGLTPSALARKAGLDPTAFNPSKRRSADGRARWLSMESIAKVLDATGASLEEFTAAVNNPLSRLVPPGSRGVTGKASNHLALARQVPLLGFAQAGVGGFFEDGGYPAGSGWDEIDLPALEEDGSYALEVQGDSQPCQKGQQEDGEKQRRPTIVHSFFLNTTSLTIVNRIGARVTGSGSADSVVIRTTTLVGSVRESGTNIGSGLPSPSLSFVTPTARISNDPLASRRHSMRSSM